MKQTKNIALLLLPFIVLTAFMTVTDPYKMPLPMLLVPFLLIGFGIYRIVTEVLKHTPVKGKKVRFTSGIITGITLLAVLLQSIRQLSIKDFLIMAALTAGATLYIRRIDV